MKPRARGCRSSRWAAATAWSPGPRSRPGSSGWPAPARGPVCRARRSKRWRSSPTSSRCRGPRSTRSAASTPRACSTTCSSDDSCASPAGRRRRAGPTCSRPRASSWSRSAFGTSATCPRSRASWWCRSWRSSPSMAKLRLNKILAQAGLTSRRGGDRLIVDGHVAVNGAVTRTPATLADPELDAITVDGRRLPPAEAKRYVLLNKPRGYVTTLSDPQGRPVVADLVERDVRLYPVGRLDWDVEGALLLTNDGPLTHRLLHPRYALPRVYEALVEGSVARGDLERWRRGVGLDDGPAKPLAIELERTGPRESRLRLTFAEGRKHEVKRFCEALGHRVVALRRIAFGPVALGPLRPGQSRPLTAREVSALRAAVAAPEGPSGT